MSRLTTGILVALAAVSAAACGKKRVDDTTPLREWECQGRRTNGPFRMVVRASSRDDAIAEVRKQYPDAGSTTSCVPKA